MPAAQTAAARARRHHNGVAANHEAESGRQMIARVRRESLEMEECCEDELSTGTRHKGALLVPLAVSYAGAGHSKPRHSINKKRTSVSIKKKRASVVTTDDGGAHKSPSPSIKLKKSMNKKTSMNKKFEHCEPVPNAARSPGKEVQVAAADAALQASRESARMHTAKEHHLSVLTEAEKLRTTAGCAVPKKLTPLADEQAPVATSSALHSRRRCGDAREGPACDEPALDGGDAAASLVTGMSFADTGSVAKHGNRRPNPNRRHFLSTLQETQHKHKLSGTLANAGYLLGGDAVMASLRNLRGKQERGCLPCFKRKHTNGPKVAPCGTLVEDFQLLPSMEQEIEHLALLAPDMRKLAKAFETISIQSNTLIERRDLMNKLGLDDDKCIYFQ
jgi:hypothetical protein